MSASELRADIEATTRVLVLVPIIMLIGSYPFRYRSRRDRRFSAAAGQFSSNELIDGRARCSPHWTCAPAKTSRQWHFRRREEFVPRCSGSCRRAAEGNQGQWSDLSSKSYEGTG